MGGNVEDDSDVESDNDNLPDFRGIIDSYFI